MTEQEKERAAKMAAAGAKEVMAQLGTIGEERQQEHVIIENAIHVRRGTVTEYKVKCSYGDIVLIIGLLMDYVRILDEFKGDDVQYTAYYRKKFLKIAERLEEQIGYDYEQAVKNCRKKEEKVSSDVGEEAMVLMLRRAAKEKKEKKEKKEEKEEKNAVCADDTE